VAHAGKDCPKPCFFLVTFRGKAFKHMDQRSYIYMASSFTHISDFQDSLLQQLSQLLASWHRSEEAQSHASAPRVQLQPAKDPAVPCEKTHCFAQLQACPLASKQVVTCPLWQ
jgi:hypothetical protein